MRFEILDSARGNKPVTRPRDYYLNGDGRLFYDCDPNGVDMSGKRRIAGADSNRFSVVAVPSASTNSASPKLPTLEECERWYIKKKCGFEHITELEKNVICEVHDYICRQLRAGT